MIFLLCISVYIYTCISLFGFQFDVFCCNSNFIFLWRRRDSYPISDEGLMRRLNGLKTSERPWVWLVQVVDELHQFFSAKKSQLLHNEYCTPPKFNIAPEKWWLEDESPFGFRPIFRVYVKLSGGICSSVDTSEICCVENHLWAMSITWKPSEKKWLDLLHLNWWWNAQISSPPPCGGVSLTALGLVVASHLRPTRDTPRRLRRRAVVKAEVLPAQPVPEGIEAPPYVADPDQVANGSVVEFPQGGAWNPKSMKI